jgi:molecular chaperone GrpE
MQDRETPEPDTPDEQDAAHSAATAEEIDAAPVADETADADLPDTVDMGEAEEAAEETPEETMESLRQQLQAAEDRVLRAQAELENYRKRVGRERTDERRYANLPLMRELLPVLDNLDRAIEAAEKSHDVDALLEGVKMVGCQFVGVLAKHDCVPIEALNESFDPHRHEAILHQPSEDVPADMVTHVTQTGYRLHDRVVRPTQVIVSSGPPQAEDDD